MARRKLFHNPNQLEFLVEGNRENPSFSSSGVTAEQARKRARSELGKGRYLLDRIDRSKLPELSMPDSITAKFIASLIDQSVPMDEIARRAAWNPARNHVDGIYASAAKSGNLPYFFAFLVGIYDSQRDTNMHPTKKAKRKSFIGWLANTNPEYDIAQYPGLPDYLAKE